MKTPRSLVIILVVLLFSVLWQLAAQENGVSEKVYAPPLVKTLESGETEIELQQVLPTPTWGVFYSFSGQFPPTPFPPNPELGLPVYFWNEGIFLFDDEGLNMKELGEAGVSLFNTGNAFSKANRGESFLLSEGPPAPGEGGDSEESSTNSLPPAFSYTNGELYLDIDSYDSNWMTLKIVNTMENGFYEILTKTNLSEPTWTVDHGVIGLDNLTLANAISVSGKPNLFFLARNSGQDEDGDGLPDWWEIENGLDPNNSDTGNTGTSDGYKDGDGDGWSNLEEFQNGTLPTGFNTPLVPSSLRLRAANGAITLTWNKSPGPVTGYIIRRAEYRGSAFQVIATVSPDTTSYTDTGGFVMGEPDPGSQVPSFDPQSSIYQIQATYSGGNSPVFDSQINAGDPDFSVEANLFRTENGHWSIACANIPTNVASVRLYWFEWYYYYDLGSFDSSTDLALTNFLSGIYAIPDAEITTRSTGDLLWVQGVGADGSVGVPVYAGKISQDAPYFVDGREHAKQNLLFQLRAATRTQPISLWDVGYVAGGMMGSYGIPSNTNYVESSFFHAAVQSKISDNPRSYLKLDGLWPFKANYKLHNSLYDPSNAVPASFTWEPDFLPVPSPAVLEIASTYWIWQDFGNLPDVAANISGGSISLQGGARNLYGLEFETALVKFEVRNFFDDSLISPAFTLAPGASIASSNANVFLSQTSVPVLQTVDYYFSLVDTPGTDPIYYEGFGASRFPSPITEGFNNTNQTPVIIVSAGRRTIVGGWARQEIINGYSDKFAYLGQYFENAYQITTNDVVTTNRAGILSPYGEFFPTQPGRAALVTMPDLDTGLRGTGIVHVIKLQLDVNHDGIIDHTLEGPDNTTIHRPFVFWVNDDNDGEYISDEFPGKERDLPKHPDNADGEIKSVRDLEDFARLWVGGLPANPGDLHATLHWEVYSGTPAIKLYRAAETNGGIGYLTNLTVAKAQIDVPGRGTQFDNELRFAYRTIAGTEPVEIGFNGNDLRFIFEGSGIGSGALVLTILKGTESIASTSAYFDLKNVKDLYERVLANNVSPDFPPSTLTSEFRITRPLADNASEAKQTIVFVHGINNTDWEYQNTSETAFKRLYWSGYQGRFSSFRWPSPLLPNCNGTGGGSPFNYNKGEYIAFKSANALKGYLQKLTNDLSGYTVNILAHSMGGIVTSEALRLGAPFNNCILSQAAVPAHAYDVNAPFLQKFLDAEPSKPTPFTVAQGGYHGYFTNLTGNIINFYNTNDYALVSGTCPLLGEANWEKNHVSLKPVFAPISLSSIAYSYSTNTQESYADLTIGEITVERTVTDAYEKKAMVARTRSQALGGQAGVAGVISTINSVDLEMQFGFGGTREDHSGQFTRNIQILKGYYDRVIDIVDTP